MDGRLVESTMLSCESPVYQMVAAGEREAVAELDNGAVLTYSEVRTLVTLDMKMRPYNNNCTVVVVQRK
jgi:hypothetical protein